VQAEKQKERQQSKKQQIHQIQHLRKQREKSGFAGELNFDEAIEQMGQPRQQQQQKGRTGERIRAGERMASKKRQLKDAKFGFGGRKRLRKQNDAFSSASTDGYKPGRFDDGIGRKGGKGKPGGVKGGVNKKKGGKQNRPGKARRQQMKQKGQ
jgi:rRNA-processing protein EBP2